MDDLDAVQQLFDKEWEGLKSAYSQYIDSVEKTRSTQSACAQSVKHCKSYMKYISREIEKLEKIASGDEKKQVERARLDIQRKELMMRDVEEMLPRQPGMYLRVVLGALNISLLSKQDKFAYKNDYEQFKIVVSAISAVLAFVLCFFVQNRIVDAIFHFLLVWYYCTLTIRERILIANGSRIKGWWNIYHFISTACAGIMLIWPYSRSYDEFRDQFMLFSLYLNIVHCIQYHYQVGCLYKLRALGDRHPMDITVDGFMSWMFRRITFILPFLFCAYGFELYNAYRLYKISNEPYCHEWQVRVVALIYLILSLGNIITVCRVIRQKFFLPPPTIVRFQLSRKYSFAKPDIVNVEIEELRRKYNSNHPDFGSSKTAGDNANAEVGRKDNVPEQKEET